MEDILGNGSFIVPPKQTDKFEGFCETCKHGVYVSGDVVYHNESCSCDHIGIVFRQTLSFDDEISSQIRIKSVTITEAGKGMGSVSGFPHIDPNRNYLKDPLRYGDPRNTPPKSDEIRTTSSTGGAKGIKPETFAFIPVGPMNAVARIYGKGAEKYSETPDKPNWRKGYEWSKSYNAAMRHLTTFWNGEDVDSEMQESHLAAVVFHCFSLMEFKTTHPEFDDRYKQSKAWDEELQSKIADEL